jgi:hypothetical protein
MIVKTTDVEKWRRQIVLDSKLRLPFSFADIVSGSETAAAFTYHH